MRLLPLALVALAACSSDPAVTPDPTDVAAAATGVGGGPSSSAATTDAASTADASSSTADTSTGVGGHGGEGGQGGDGGAPSTTSTTGAGGQGGAPMQGGGFEDGTRLRARYNRGTDGSRAPRGDFLDERLNAVCSFRLADDGQTRCLPIAGAYLATFQFRYADAACTQIAALIPGGCSPSYVGTSAPAAPECGARETIYQVGAPAPAAGQRFRLIGGNCEAEPEVLDGYTFITPVPAASFVAATIETD